MHGGRGEHSMLLLRFTRSLVLLLVLAAVIVPQHSYCTPYFTSRERARLSGTQRIFAIGCREEVKEMFYHAWNGYLQHAFPADELQPLSCTGRYRQEHGRGSLDDALGNFSLTLVDSMDTLVVFGDLAEFEKAVNLAASTITFDTDVTVSLFETTIRMLGGLLSSHILAERFLLPEQGLHYDRGSSGRGVLLEMALDLGYRLLPAFDTPTGIPYSLINLRKGVPAGVTTQTCLAGAGTLLVEFGALSRLSGVPVFEEVTKRAIQELWARRSPKTQLLGNLIDVHSGIWLIRKSGIGAGFDSFYEYLLKAYYLYGADEHFEMFNTSYNAIMTYSKQGNWYFDVSMDTGGVVDETVDSLQAFWPGLLVLYGDVSTAIEAHSAYYSIWSRFGFTPEVFHVSKKTARPGHGKSYPLRPELVESTFMLYGATKDKHYLQVGQHILQNLRKTRTPCGYAAVADVQKARLEDRMDSFFLSETLKYLYLLFDYEKNVFAQEEDLLFSTEGHFFPVFGKTIAETAEKEAKKDGKNEESIAEAEKEETGMCDGQLCQPSATATVQQKREIEKERNGEEGKQIKANTTHSTARPKNGERGGRVNDAALSKPQKQHNATLSPICPLPPRYLPALSWMGDLMGYDLDARDTALYILGVKEKRFPLSPHSETAPSPSYSVAQLHSLGQSPKVVGHIPVNLWGKEITVDAIDFYTGPTLVQLQLRIIEEDEDNEEEDEAQKVEKEGIKTKSSRTSKATPRKTREELFGGAKTDYLKTTSSASTATNRKQSDIDASSLLSSIMQEEGFWTITTEQRWDEGNEKEERDEQMKVERVANKLLQFGKENLVNLQRDDLLTLRRVWKYIEARAKDVKRESEENEKLVEVELEEEGNEEETNLREEITVIAEQWNKRRDDRVRERIKERIKDVAKEKLAQEQKLEEEKANMSSAEQEALARIEKELQQQKNFKEEAMHELIQAKEREIHHMTTTTRKQRERQTEEKGRIQLTVVGVEAAVGPTFAMASKSVDGDAANFEGEIVHVSSFILSDENNNEKGAEEERWHALKEELAGKFVLIWRGNCTFVEKLKTLESLGAKAAVVINHMEDQLPFTMSGGEAIPRLTNPEDDIHIPSLMLSYEDGLLLKGQVSTIDADLNDFTIANQNEKIEKEEVERTKDTKNKKRRAIVRAKTLDGTAKVEAEKELGFAGEQELRLQEIQHAMQFVNHGLLAELSREFVETRFRCQGPQCLAHGIQQGINFVISLDSIPFQFPLQGDEEGRGDEGVDDDDDDN